MAGRYKMILFVTHSVDEAVFLADKIILMSAQNRNVRDILEIKLPRPRRLYRLRFYKIEK